MLDLVFMPGMYFAGMMSQPGFAAAGYTIFGEFNRIELLCAALVLSGLLLLRWSYQEPTANKQAHPLANLTWTIPISGGLMAIALIYTYTLTPEMSALGMQLDWLNSTTSVPAGMNQMHLGYWMLEAIKVGAIGVLLKALYTTKFSN